MFTFFVVYLNWCTESRNSFNKPIFLCNGHGEIENYQKGNNVAINSFYLKYLDILLIKIKYNFNYDNIDNNNRIFILRHSIPVAFSTRMFKTANAVYVSWW